MQRQQKLKQKLEENTVTEIEFLDALMDLDQETPTHVECFDNVVILENENLKARLLSSSHKVQSLYLSRLRFFHFHAFQNIAGVQRINISQAVEHLRKACELGDQYTKLNPSKEDLFLPYMKATLCYMENDIEGLNRYLEILNQVNENHMMFVNTKIIRNLKKDLIEFKEPVYNRKK